MIETLHQKLHAARHQHPVLMKRQADDAGSPQTQHGACVAVESNERQMAILGESIEELEAVILLVEMTLAKLGPAPGARRISLGRTRIEEGLLWLRAELGTPVSVGQSC